MRRCAFVPVTMALLRPLSIGCCRQRADSTSTHSVVISTPIEKALRELRVRFSEKIVIGFEELREPRPEREPEIDLGPMDLPLEEVVNHVRSIDPKYHLELLHGGLIHVYPRSETADPVGLLDIWLREFVMPQDSCLGQAMEYIDDSFHGYAPELFQFLANRKYVWYREHGQQVPGTAGDILGNCTSPWALGPVYRNISVRRALNLMGIRSLRVSRGEVAQNDPSYRLYKPLSWKLNSDVKQTPTQVLEEYPYSRSSRGSYSADQSI